MTTHPRARDAGLIVRELDGELLVYDVKRDAASALNAFAASVWRECDGASDAQAIARRLSAAGPHVAPEAVARALALLTTSDLIEASGADEPAAGRSRRQALRAVGVGAAALAVVTTIAAPALAAGVSCVANGGPCINNNECCSDFCDLGAGGICEIPH
jgi:hypothetical protein